MDFKIQTIGLNDLLSAIYGEEQTLHNLFGELGFETSQIERLSDRALEAVVAQFLQVIHERLTSDAGKDTYYQILARYYGLDGEPRESLSALAARRDASPEYLRQLFEEILERCKSKTWQKELKIALKHIVVNELRTVDGQPAREHIVEKLERLTNLRGAADVARMEYEAKRTEILQRIQSDLDALELEFTPVLDAVEENIIALENEIKTDVLLYGESVTGGSYRATYTQGRVSWDTEKMTHYAKSHPDILQFRKQGNPIISLRAVNTD